MVIKIFTPIESVNPLYLGGAEEDLYERILKEHNGRTFAEIKEDGYRMQIHKKGSKVLAFTRSMNPIILDLFPEIASSLKKLPDCILDSELIGSGKIGHQGYDLVKRRFRSRIGEEGKQEYLKSGIVEDLPLAIRVFDTLYWENVALVDLPLEERRKYTEKIASKKISPSDKRDINNSLDLGNLFESLVAKRYEGLVCKNPASLYVPGTRNTDWIKLKRAETLDLCVLGAYMSGNEISQLLCGVYNPKKECFETLAKVNAKRNSMNLELEARLKDNLVWVCPPNVNLNAAIHKTPLAYPDYFIEPEKSVVVEVAAMNFYYSKNWHSCGLDKDGKSYSLRIGWLKGIREDKSISDTASVDSVKTLYDTERGAE
jgi:DNA ligase-1